MALLDGCIQLANLQRGTLLADWVLGLLVLFDQLVDRCLEGRGEVRG